VHPCLTFLIRDGDKAKNGKRLLLTYGAFIFLSVPSSFLTVLMIERTFGDSYVYLTVNEMAGFAGMVLGGILLGSWLKIERLE
jgi:DHA3 family macrolide efflux protein-like MFS transporter